MVGPTECLCVCVHLSQRPPLREKTKAFCLEHNLGYENVFKLAERLRAKDAAKAGDNSDDKHSTVVADKSAEGSTDSISETIANEPAAKRKKKQRSGPVLTSAATSEGPSTAVPPAVVTVNPPLEGKPTPVRPLYAQRLGVNSARMCSSGR